MSDRMTETENGIMEWKIRKRERENDETGKPVSLTEGSIWKSILYFALPIMASNFFQQFYNLVDSIVIGRFESSEALAAVSSVTPVINLIINMFLGVTTGAGVVVAIYIGAGDSKATEKSVHTAVILGVLSGIICTVIGIGLAPFIPGWMNFTAETCVLATKYLIAYFAGILPMLMYNMGSSILRAAGDSRRPFYFLVAGGLLNCVLDILFVAVWKWGVIGAGAASSLAQLMAAMLTMGALLREKGDCRLEREKLHLDETVARQIIRIGLPTGLSNCMFSISNTLMQTKLNMFGTAAMAGTGAYMKLDGFLYTMENSFGLTATTFTGQNLGAGRLDRVKEGTKVAMAYCFLFVIPLTAVYVLFGKLLMQLFSSDPEVVDYGLQLMHYMAPFGWIYIFTEVLGCVVRGAGSTTIPMTIMILTVCVFRMSMIFAILPFWYDIRVMFLCYPISWVMSSLCFIVYYRKGNWVRGLRN